MSSTELTDIDRAFITELVYGAVKWKLTLDTVIASFSKIKMERLSPWILNILRLGSYQLLKMEKVPQSAACNESVRLAGRYGHKGSAGFVNALLRNIARSSKEIKLPPKEEGLTNYLSVRYSYPVWLTEKFIKLFEADFAESLLAAGNSIPELTIRANTLKVSPGELMDKLRTEGVEALPGKYISEAAAVKSQVSIAKLEAYKKGLFQVQDESSMLPAIVLAPQPGDIVLDACSAPGGKATHMAQLMCNQGKIIAWDIHEHKLKLVDDSAKRLGIDIIECELNDAGMPDEKYDRAFDRVLLDAPCMGLGIIRRKPDIKWVRKAEDIAQITVLQERLIQKVSSAVKPGGILVYSTCTVLPEENENIVTGFLKRNHDFEEDDIVPFLPAALKAHSKGCMLQVYPNRDGIDGFFIARLKRKGGAQESSH